MTLRRLSALALLLLAACGEPAPSAPATREIGGRPVGEFLIERDRFLAADEPATVPNAQAEFLQPEDEVLGLVVGGHARAYPVPMIAWHHVVNDVIEGIPVAVTY